MICKKCGASLQEDMAFCIECGAKVEPSTPTDHVTPKDPHKNSKLKRVNWPALVLAVAFVIVSIVAIQTNSNKKYYEQQSSRYWSQLSSEKTLSAEYKVYKDFMDKYIRIVPDDDSGLFHKHGCTDLSLQSFWAYNIDAAENKAEPCPKCCGD